MPVNQYHFRSVWSVPAPSERVFDVLADVGEYWRWWREVRTVTKVDDHCAEFVCRSLLPYDLVFRANHHTRDEQAGVLRARLTGDLDGVCGWTLTRRREGTELVFDQQVRVMKPLVRMFAPVARPLLLANHALMMRSGRAGLLGYLGGTNRR